MHPIHTWKFSLTWFTKPYFHVSMHQITDLITLMLSAHSVMNIFMATPALPCHSYSSYRNFVLCAEMLNCCHSFLTLSPKAPLIFLHGILLPELRSTPIKGLIIKRLSKGISRVRDENIVCQVVARTQIINYQPQPHCTILAAALLK